MVQLLPYHSKLERLSLLATSALGNWDFDFFNFSQCQVQNFKISNQFEWDQNFADNFWKCQKRKRKSTKYIISEQKNPTLIFESKVKSLNLRVETWAKVLKFMNGPNKLGCCPWEAFPAKSDKVSGSPK